MPCGGNGVGMNRIRLFLVSLFALFALFGLSAPSSAEEDVETVETVETVEVAEEADVPDGGGVLSAELMALFPIVILVSSLVLGPGASDRLKKLLPGLVTIAVSVIYFLVDTFPGFGVQVVASVGGLSVLATQLYPFLSSVIETVTGKTLNQLTGPGVVGREPSEVVEGD
jgi:hypothetical protein